MANEMKRFLSNVYHNFVIMTYHKKKEKPYAKNEREAF